MTLNGDDGCGATMNTPQLPCEQWVQGRFSAIVYSSATPWQRAQKLSLYFGGTKRWMVDPTSITSNKVTGW